MSYYIFKPAVNTSETGPVFPQVQKMRPGYNYKAPNSVYALSREVKQLPDYTPDLDYFIVNGKAKLTDLLSVSVIHGGFLVSAKLKQVLQGFYLPTHQFYPARIEYKKNYYDYFWMHIICNLTDQVDYVRSSFFIYYNYAHNLGSIEVSSLEDLVNKEDILKKNNPGKTVAIWAEHIQLGRNFDQSRDLFKISNFDSNYYISEKLKIALYNANVSGCHIEPAKNLNI